MVGGVDVSRPVAGAEVRFFEHARARTRRTNAVIIGVLLFIIVATATLSISLGASGLNPIEFVTTLFGGGSRVDNLVVFRLRLPRLALGVLVGAAFGVAGALFQTVLRNPLASPDILGISGGASVAAAFGILVLGVSGASVSLLAFLGAVVVAAIIYSLSYSRGISGYRFVLIGVGVAFVCQSVLGFLISRTDVRDASQALVWMVGGLGNADWSEILVLVVSLAVLMPLVAVLAPRLRMLQLGDDAAGGLGVRVGVARPMLLLVAVGLTAIATAFAGPVAFVAFVSAPIARRLQSDGSLALVPSALVGAALVLVADLVGQHLIAGVQVPAGIVTGIIGAPYLLWLLATSNSKGRA